MSASILGFFSTYFDDASGLTFGDLFVEVGDSMLTTLMLCFLAHWVLKICIDLGKGGQR